MSRDHMDINKTIQGINIVRRYFLKREDSQTIDKLRRKKNEGNCQKL